MRCGKRGGTRLHPGGAVNYAGLEGRGGTMGGRDLAHLFHKMSMAVQSPRTIIQLAVYRSRIPDHTSLSVDHVPGCPRRLHLSIAVSRFDLPAHSTSKRRPRPHTTTSKPSTRTPLRLTRSTPPSPSRPRTARNCSRPDRPTTPTSSTRSSARTGTTRPTSSSRARTLRATGAVGPTATRRTATTPLARLHR